MNMKKSNDHRMRANTERLKGFVKYNNNAQATTAQVMIKFGATSGS